MMFRSSAAKGFTLIELAIVIAIVGILAAVAIPRFANLTGNAERAVAQNFISQLKTAAATFTARQAAEPTGFNQFVTRGVNANTVPAGNTTIVTPVSPQGQAYCQNVGAATINCNFPNFRNGIQYRFQNGSITCPLCNSAVQ